MSIIWKPDLSKGAADFTGVESVDAKTRITVVPAPESVAGKALRFVVRQGDVVQGTNGTRAEVWRDDKRPDGAVRAHAFSVYFPAGFPTLVGAWQVFHQYHQGYKGPDTIGRSPPVEFALNGDKMQINTNGPVDPFPAKTHWSAPLIRDRWLRFVLFAKWSVNDGWIQAFLDGKEIVPKTPAIIMFANAQLGNVGIYAKWGLYRKPTIAPEATIYHADLVEADQLVDVLPAPAPPVPAPVPTPPVDPADVGWRAGRKVGRTLYVDGKLIGMVDTRELAAQIVAAMNAQKGG